MTLSPCGAWIATAWRRLGELAEAVAVPPSFRPDVALMASEELRRRLYVAEHTAAGRFWWRELERACVDLSEGTWDRPAWGLS
ncbi:MAG: hypothetical protein KIT14_13990 [bacterium]|nr:hypothetical protein [bacterium]MCW5891643.1 hypothetical protein [bacterium]